MITENKMTNKVSNSQTISVAIATFNEENNIIDCIQSLKKITTDIVVVDGQSTDKTRDWAESAGAKVISVPNNPMFHKNKNHAIKNCKGNWILLMDADERVSGELATEIKHIIGTKPKENGFWINRSNWFLGGFLTKGGAYPDPVIRLFRNGKGIKFFGYVHEHPEIELNKSVGFSTIISDVDIAHDGYLTEEGRRKRFNRNYKLLLIDRERNPDRELGKFLIMRDYIHMVRYIMEQTKGQLTQEIIDYCNKTIEMYRNEFLGKNEMMAIDGLMFYSEALTMLNKGLEYDFSIDIKPMGALAKDNFKTRFENKKDFIKFIEALSEMQIEHFSGDYV